MLGVLFGALILAGERNAKTLMAIRPEAMQIAHGRVIALATWLDLRPGRN